MGTFTKQTLKRMQFQAPDIVNVGLDSLKVLCTSIAEGGNLFSQSKRDIIIHV